MPVTQSRIVSFVFDQIRRATHESGREEDGVRLVAATKSVTVNRIREAIAAGVQIAGGEPPARSAQDRRVEGIRIAGHFHRPASTAESSRGG